MKMLKTPCRFENSYETDISNFIKHLSTVKIAQISAAFPDLSSWSDQDARLHLCSNVPFARQGPTKRYRFTWNKSPFSNTKGSINKLYRMENRKLLKCDILLERKRTLRCVHCSYLAGCT